MKNEPRRYYKILSLIGGVVIFTVSGGGTCRPRIH